MLTTVKHILEKNYLKSFGLQNLKIEVLFPLKFTGVLFICLEKD